MIVTTGILKDCLLWKNPNLPVSCNKKNLQMVIELTVSIDFVAI
jgi:hypothetical protein